MLFTVQKVLQALLLPPASLIIMIIAGLVLSRWRRTLGRILLSFGIILLYVLSLDPVSERLIRPLEAAFRPYVSTDLRPDAVVVLGGGVHNLSWLPAPNAPTEHSLERLVAGIHRAQTLGLPLILAGGSGRITPGGVPEADAMANVAVMLGFPRKDLIADNSSRNTWENAAAVKKVIQGRTVILVTSAYHMMRSAGMFKKQGFTVIPDPTGYHEQTQQLAPAHLLPRASALDLSSMALAEYLSLAWYWSAGKL